MSRTTRAIAVSAALMFSLHMVSLHGAQKPPKPAPAPHAAKPTTAKPHATKPAAPKTVAAGHKVTKQPAPKTAKAAAPKGTTAKPAPKLAKQGADKTKPAAKPAATKAAKKDTASLKKAAVTKKADATKKNASTKKADATKKKTEATTVATTTTTPIPLENLSPVQQKLAKNTNLASKLQSRLPAGTNLMEAADGFRNLGQFVAAVNVSNNLKIPFENLKTDMVTKNMSLGQSIQDLRPASSAAVEAQHAEYDANTLIAKTEQEMSVTVSTKVMTTTASTSATAPAKPRKGNRKTLTGGV
jgi:hypothetical protein